MVSIIASTVVKLLLEVLVLLLLAVVLVVGILRLRLLLLVLVGTTTTTALAATNGRDTKLVLLVVATPRSRALGPSRITMAPSPRLQASLARGSTV